MDLGPLSRFSVRNAGSLMPCVNPASSNRSVPPAIHPPSGSSMMRRGTTTGLGTAVGSRSCDPLQVISKLFRIGGLTRATRSCMMTLGGLGDRYVSTPSPLKLAPVSTGVGVIPRGGPTIIGNDHRAQRFHLIQLPLVPVPPKWAQVRGRLEDDRVTHGKHPGTPRPANLGEVSWSFCYQRNLDNWT